MTQLNELLNDKIKKWNDRPSLKRGVLSKMYPDILKSVRLQGSVGINNVRATVVFKHTTVKMLQAIPKSDRTTRSPPVVNWRRLDRVLSSYNIDGVYSQTYCLKVISVMSVTSLLLVFEERSQPIRASSPLPPVLHPLRTILNSRRTPQPRPLWVIG